MDDELIDAIANLEEEGTMTLVQRMIASGYTAAAIIELCRKGVEIVGQRYKEGNYYLFDLIMSREILKDVIEIVEPYFPVKPVQTRAKIVMGTIQGDIHDLGKEIVIFLLRSSGYEVYDLGVDVPPRKFVQSLKETGATILGVCVLLTFCIGYIKELVDLLKREGLRDKVTVVLGGYPVNALVKEYTGADYYSNDAIQGMEIFGRIAQAE
jgi:methylmalonyl-CoA mutase cobalamin-binding domain/chain